MKTHPSTRRLSPWTWAFIAFAIFFLTFVCLGQDATDKGGAWAANMAVPMAQPQPVADVPPVVTPPWAQLFAASMAFVVALVALARIIVMFTPTNTDNEFVETCVKWLKRVGLHISVILFLTAIVGCATTPAPVGQIGASADSQGNVSNVIGGLTWDATTNVNVTVNGQIDPTTGEWSSNLLITFRTNPDATVQALAAKAGAYVRKGTVTSYVLQYDSTNRDHRLFVREAQLKGALISGLK